MFRIKICGVTSAKDATFVTLAGADAIGLNFFAESKRYVAPEAADSICKMITPKTKRVGVFVNHSPTEIRAIAERHKLDWIQLHGDEPPEHIRDLSGKPVIRAFRFGDSGFGPLLEYLDACQGLGTMPRAILVDASVPGEFGGTGETVDWGQLAAARSQLPPIPLILAGGLTPFNVAEAIAAVQPDGVDVAGGVESKPGVKDLLLVRAFVTAAKKALPA